MAKKMSKTLVNKINIGDGITGPELQCALEFYREVAENLGFSNVNIPSRHEVKIKEAKAASASLYLAPASGTYVIGSTFSISVKVNSGGGDGQ